MRKIIISVENCQKCKMLMAQCPEAEHVELKPDELLQFTRTVGIQSMPFLVCVGDVQELDKILK